MDTTLWAAGPHRALTRWVGEIDLYESYRLFGNLL
jgi:hypothetical protein